MGAWPADWRPDVLRAWYGGGSIRHSGASRGRAPPRRSASGSLSRDSPCREASAYARARFERPSVWRRTCPHVVDALDRDADKCLEDHRYARATRLYDAALDHDPRDWHARFERAWIDAFYGGHERGRADLEGLAGNDDVPRTWRDRAEETVADDDMARGSLPRAVATYRALEAHILDEDVARTLEVKAESGEGPDAVRASRAVVDLLIGQPGLRALPWLGGLSLGTWAADAHGPLASYLVGKNLALHEQYVRAASWLDRALDAGHAAPLIARELLRQRAVCACVLRDSASMDQVERRATAPGSPFEQSPGGGRKQWLLDFLARCRTAP